MELTTILFLILSLISIGSAVMMLMSRNPVYSVLWLILLFFTISAHYLMLNAQFLAVVNIIVYAGAIMVLFLFVVMLMNLNADTEPMKNYRLQLVGVIAGGSLLLILVSAVMKIENNQPVMLMVGDYGLIKVLDKTLFQKFVLPFEISSILFLSAIIGAMVIAKRDTPSQITKGETEKRSS